MQILLKDKDLRPFYEEFKVKLQKAYNTVRTLEVGGRDHGGESGEATEKTPAPGPEDSGFGDDCGGDDGSVGDGPGLDAADETAPAKGSRKGTSCTTCHAPATSR